MIDIPVNANVECTDGLCGRSTYVIINPTIKQVTHFVVKEKGFRPTERLVSVDRIVETTPDLIRLRCTKDELATLEPFVETHYIQVERPRYEQVPYLMFPYTVPQETVMVPVEHERIPPGELAVHRGAQVEATDGRVGRVDEFLVDSTTGHITHLVLREGHLWGEKELTIPVSGIHHIEEDVVYLKLDKHTIESLPAIPVKRRYDWGYIMDVELIVLTFNEEGKANEVLQALKQLDKEGVIKVLNAAVLIKDQDGKAFLRETEDVDAKHGALFGAIAGGLIGLVGGPAGAIVGAAAGAAIGGVAVHGIDMGFPDETLKDLQRGLQPGSSAIIALVEHKWVEKVIEALAEFGGQLFRQMLTDAIVDQLTAAAEAEGGDET